ncbi:NADPH-dependent FMN reductase [Halomicrobium sp. LC1Hm]|uniref:NADPH-dependent FMN reductase n=1 Tax=Halomicrobium sp. LC1Hm TaxID=2610902 RepID=UPI001298538E|nr:NADPH-dependent FMN reductase [Halomicrobium sp. LC1Hm]QGA82672.1 Multimeric flavodoxin WrbA [Halomicrobium sp. LC1Hm]
MTRTTVVGICGSLREGSYTRQSLRVALAAAAAAGGDTELLDLREWDLPVFDPDAEDAGDAAAFREQIRGADSVLLGTPVYHGSFSTPLKNALDYCGFDEFENKTVGLLCVAGGSFPLTALEHLRSVGRSLDCWVIPHQAAVPRAASAFEDGRLVDEQVRERIETLGREAVQYAGIEPDPQSIESCENVGADD